MECSCVSCRQLLCQSGPWRSEGSSQVEVGALSGEGASGQCRHFGGAGEGQHLEQSVLAHEGVMQGRLG